MSRTLGLISCTKVKKNYPCRAREMYAASDLFRKAYAYAIKHYDDVAILSAKYGLLSPDEEIIPYELTLNKMTKAYQNAWAERVFTQLKNRFPFDQISTVFFHAGIAYRRHLVPLLVEQGIRCVAPMQGLGLGKQKAWYLSHEAGEESRRQF